MSCCGVLEDRNIDRVVDSGGLVWGVLEGSKDVYWGCLCDFFLKLLLRSCDFWLVGVKELKLISRKLEYKS